MPGLGIMRLLTNMFEKQSASSGRQSKTEHVTRPVPINNDVAFGASRIFMMSGPCSVENYAQMRVTAEAIALAGGKIIRGGAFKPRTSPHSFQGLGLPGLEILRAVADEFGLLVITEALGVEHVPIVAELADIIQVGSRNMQHYPLLWSVGELDKPVVLKRGFMSTVDEWLQAADHISSRGNERIILCERGIRTFESATRNTLAIALVKKISSHPVIVDPSHATGRADLVLPAARSAVAAGADGLLLEIHPDPALALSDGPQSLPVAELADFYRQVGAIANAMGRELI